MNEASLGIRMSELGHVAGELQTCVGRSVDQVWVPTPTSVVLDFGATTWLVESHPAPRVHPLRARPRPPSHPYSFQGLLRKRLVGPLTSVALDPGDRVLTLVFGSVRLVARLFGRAGGIWLLDDDRVVAGSEGPAPEQLPPLAGREPDTKPPRFVPDRDGLWGPAACRFFTTAVAAHEAEERRQRLISEARRKLRRLDRLIENLDGDRAGTQRAETLRAQADALSATLHSVPRGAERVQLTSLDDPDTQWTVSLLPGQPPSATLTALYDKASRLVRARAPLDARRAAVLAEQEEAAATLNALLTGSSSALPAQRPSSPRLAKPGPADPWWKWAGPKGETLLVGKHDRGNHALVFRHARGRDWWAHVQGQAGAHVVVPWTRTDAAPPEHVLHAAAELAAWSSRVAAGQVVEVQLARVRDVRAIKGAGPGRVTVRNARVVMLTAPSGPPDRWTRDDPPPS